jgi:hypothetical protein
LGASVMLRLRHPAIIFYLRRYLIQFFAIDSAGITFE